MTYPPDWTEVAVHEYCSQLSDADLREFRHLLALLVMVVDLETAKRKIEQEKRQEAEAVALVTRVAREVAQKVSE